MECEICGRSDAKSLDGGRRLCFYCMTAFRMGMSEGMSKMSAKEVRINA